MTNLVGLKSLVPRWPLALFRIAFGLLCIDLALQKAPWIGFGWRQPWLRARAVRGAAWAGLLRRAA